MKTVGFVLAAVVLASAPFTGVGAQTSPPGQSEPQPGKVEVPAASPAGTADEPLESVVVQGHFLGSAAQSALKLDAPVLDTPFAVQSYTDSFMKAIETTNIDE